jgi:hypothetical protein
MGSGSEKRDPDPKKGSGSEKGIRIRKKGSGSEKRDPDPKKILSDPQH